MSTVHPHKGPDHFAGQRRATRLYRLCIMKSYPWLTCVLHALIYGANTVTRGNNLLCKGVRSAGFSTVHLGSNAGSQGVSVLLKLACVCSHHYTISHSSNGTAICCVVAQSLLPQCLLRGRLGRATFAILSGL